MLLNTFLISLAVIGICTIYDLVNGTFGSEKKSPFLITCCGNAGLFCVCASGILFIFSLLG